MHAVLFEITMMMMIVIVTVMMMMMVTVMMCDEVVVSIRISLSSIDVFEESSRRSLFLSLTWALMIKCLLFVAGSGSEYSYTPVVQSSTVQFSSAQKKSGACIVSQSVSVIIDYRAAVSQCDHRLSSCSHPSNICSYRRDKTSARGRHMW